MIFSTQMTQIQKDIDFSKFFVEITQKRYLILPDNVKTENEPWCL